MTTVAPPLDMARKMIAAAQGGFPDEGIGSYSRRFENALLVGIPSYSSTVRDTWDALAKLGGELARPAIEMRSDPARRAAGLSRRSYPATPPASPAP